MDTCGHAAYECLDRKGINTVKKGVEWYSSRFGRIPEVRAPPHPVPWVLISVLGETHALSL